MQIEIKIDEHCTEPKITIVTNKVTDEINEMMKRLAGEQTQMLPYVVLFRPYAQPLNRFFR